LLEIRIINQYWQQSKQDCLIIYDDFQVFIQNIHVFIMYILGIISVKVASSLELQIRGHVTYHACMSSQKLTSWWYRESVPLAGDGSLTQHELLTAGSQQRVLGERSVTGQSVQILFLPRSVPMESIMSKNNGAFLAVSVSVTAILNCHHGRFPRDFVSRVLIGQYLPMMLVSTNKIPWGIETFGVTDQNDSYLPRFIPTRYRGRKDISTYHGQCTAIAYTVPTIVLCCLNSFYVPIFFSWIYQIIAREILSHVPTQSLVTDMQCLLIWWGHPHSLPMFHMLWEVRVGWLTFASDVSFLSSGTLCAMKTKLLYRNDTCMLNSTLDMPDILKSSLMITPPYNISHAKLCL